MSDIVKQNFKNQIKNNGSDKSKENIVSYSSNNNIPELLKNIPNYINQLSTINLFLFYFISFTALYIFTYPLYNIILSIIMALILFILFFFTNKVYAIIFIIIYIIIIVKIYQEKKYKFYNSIYQTNIMKNGKPYDCTSGSLVIQGNTLPNEETNVNYTYSFWLYLNGNDNDINNGFNWKSYRYNEWKSIFYRGNPIESNGNLSSLIQFPGFWLTPVLNNMVIVFQGQEIVERIEIDNIPFNTWINYTVVIDLKSVSVYIDGLLDRTLNLQQNVKIVNNSNLYITNDLSLSKENKSGFAGYLGELICFNYNLKPIEIYYLHIYYKKILEIYQFKIIKNHSNYKIPNLITNSDYF